MSVEENRIACKIKSNYLFNHTCSCLISINFVPRKKDVFQSSNSYFCTAVWLSDYCVATLLYEVENSKCYQVFLEVRLTPDALGVSLRVVPVGPRNHPIFLRLIRSHSFFLRCLGNYSFLGNI